MEISLLTEDSANNGGSVGQKLSLVFKPQLVERLRERFNRIRLGSDLTGSPSAGWGKVQPVEKGSTS